MTLQTEQFAANVERVMEIIEAHGANGMFVVVSYDVPENRLRVEMRSHWTMLGHADAALRGMLQLILDALAPHARDGDGDALLAVLRYGRALEALGAPEAGEELQTHPLIGPGRDLN